jgi:hypothetical protein
MTMNSGCPLFNSSRYFLKNKGLLVKALYHPFRKKRQSLKRKPFPPLCLKMKKWPLKFSSPDLKKDDVVETVQDLEEAQVLAHNYAEEE